MTDENQPSAENSEQDELDLKNVIEATFGAGAFDLINSAEADASASPDADTREEPPASQNESHASADADLAALESRTAAPCELVLFSVSEHLFAISATEVTEVQRAPRITRIPHVPEWVSGVTNLRGKILSVVDLRSRLGLTSPASGLRRRMIVARTTDGVSSGLLVDRVLGIRRLPDPCATNDAQDVASDFVKEWRQSDHQAVAVLNLNETINLQQTVGAYCVD